MGPPAATSDPEYNSMKTYENDALEGRQAESAVSSLSESVQKNFLTRRQVLEILDFSASTLIRLQKKGHLRPLPMGKHQIHRSEVQRYLESYKEVQAWATHSLDFWTAALTSYCKLMDEPNLVG